MAQLSRNLCFEAPAIWPVRVLPEIGQLSRCVSSFWVGISRTQATFYGFNLILPSRGPADRQFKVHSRNWCGYFEFGWLNRPETWFRGFQLTLVFRLVLGQGSRIMPKVMLVWI